MDIYEIAKLSGVSTATVSRVFNNSEKVSEKTRQKVLSTAKAVNFRPNTIAKLLASNSTLKTVGLVCADINDTYFAKAVSVLEKNLRALGYDSILCCTDINKEEKKKSIEILLSKNVDAIVFIGSVFYEKKNEYMENISSLLPVFIINGKIESDKAYSVICNDYKATKNAVKEFVKSGRRNLLYIYDSLSYSGQKKLLGFSEGAATGKNVNYYTLKTEKSSETASSKIADFLLKHKIDGIITSEDFFAVTAVNVLTKMNVAVPDKIAVLGYNNSYLCDLSSIKISSIDNKIEDMCKSAANMMQSVFSGNDTEKSITFDCEIIKRESF